MSGMTTMRETSTQLRDQDRVTEERTSLTETGHLSTTGSPSPDQDQFTTTPGVMMPGHLDTTTEDKQWQQIAWH